MIPYFVFLIMISTISIFVLENNKYNALYYKVYIPILAPLFIIFSGLASSRGDYLSYKEIFRNPFVSHTEIGFQYLNNIVKNIGGTYHLLLVICAAIAVLMKLMALKKLSPYLGLSIIIYTGTYFVPAEMGSLRFGIAMAFFLLSLPYIQERKIIQFSFLTIISATIHTFSLVTILLYIINIYKFRRRDYIIILMCMLFTYSFVDNILNYKILKEIIPSNLSFLARGLVYLGGESVGINFAIVKRILFFFVILLFYDRFKRLFPYFRVLINAYFLSIIFFFLFYASYTIANRSSWFFSAVEPVLLSGFVGIPRNNYIKGIIIALLIGFSVLSLYHMLITQSDENNLYLPYKWILDKYI